MKAITRTWKIYGAEGHRQRESFGKSFVWNFSKSENIRILEMECSDKTGTNDYVILKITRNTADDCESELFGQISDGIFENSRTGIIEEVK